MTTAHKQSEMVSTASRELDDVITNAMKKIGSKNESALCRYLPGEKGGYLHHFTLRKMKHQSPEQLSQMLKTFIINASKPATLPPKQRAARGSRKKKDHVVLAKTDIDVILQLARTTGNKELIRKLMPRRELKQLKKELIASIRHNRIEPELWHLYVETISHPNSH